MNLTSILQIKKNMFKEVKKQYSYYVEFE